MTGNLFIVSVVIFIFYITKINIMHYVCHFYYRFNIHNTFILLKLININH